MKNTFSPGDFVVYKKQKHSTKPGPRAHDIASAVQDGQFSYVVDKYWIVVEVCDDDTLVVRTRGGKSHRLRSTDPNLRHAKWWQRLWHRSRFSELEGGTENSSRES